MWCYRLLLFFGATLITTCDELTIFHKPGTRFSISVNNTRTMRIAYNTSTSRHPFRINLWRDDKLDGTVLVVLERRNKVTSWQLPYVLPTSNRSVFAAYMNFSKTLCYDKDERNLSESEFNSGKRNFTISLSTTSSETIFVYGYVETFDNFFIQVNQENYTAYVSPSKPIYYSFNYPEDFQGETVALKVLSEKESCVVVSIQRKICPVEDLNYELAPGGMFQTVKSKGGLNIWKKLYPNGFYLVFNVKADNQSCNSEMVPIEEAVFPNNKSVFISFKILDGKTKSGYLTPIILTSLTLVIIAVIISVILYFVRKRKDQQEIDRVRNEQQHNWKYFSHTLTVSVFYCVPVFQIMIFYKRSVDESGNLDNCYFNFLCSHPWYFYDFNHMFTNVGYLLFGLTFVFVALTNKKYIRNFQNYERPCGLYYAMGLALILEGILSCIYHICPNQSNFQFDTSFMYVMLVLVLAKLYQNRHIDKMDRTYYLIFVLLAVIVFLVSLEIFLKSFDLDDPWRYIIITVFNLMHLALSLYIGYKNYYKGVAYISTGEATEEELRNLNNLNELCRANNDHGEANISGNTGRLVRPNGRLTQEEREENERIELSHANNDHGEANISGNTERLVRPKNECTEHANRITTGKNIIKLKRIWAILEVVTNVVLLSLVCLVYIKTVPIDFPTYLLIILGLNAILYCGYYMLMKVVAKETINKMTWVLCVCSAILWVAASVFFFSGVTKWSKTPAESREFNTECYSLLSFYDSHDVWHLLSAVALFSTFTLLLVLDDDLLDKPRGFFCSI